MLQSAILALAMPADRPGPRQHVQARLEDAGKTLMMLPARDTPGDLRGKWPAEPVLRFWETLGGLTEDQREELIEARNYVPLRASPAQIQRMDEALQWLLWIPAGPNRRIVFARSLIHPRNERHVVSWRKLSKFMGMAVNTLQDRHERGVDLIVGKLWQIGL